MKEFFEKVNFEKKSVDDKIDFWFQEEEEEEAAPVREKSVFSVKLTSFDASKKIALIKEIKNLIPGTNLVQVNNLHDNFLFQENVLHRHTLMHVCI